MSSDTNKPEVEETSLTHRQVTVELHNKTKSFILGDPDLYVDSGHCETPLPPSLRPLESGTALFMKTPHTACGAVGVFTYGILQGSNCQEEARLAVMFSNPYDFNLYSNWYAVGEFSKYKTCDKNLFKEMYYGKETDFVRGKAKGHSLTYRGDRVTIRASMSDTYQPVLKVDICDD